MRQSFWQRIYTSIVHGCEEDKKKGSMAIYLYSHLFQELARHSPKTNPRVICLLVFDQVRT